MSNLIGFYQDQATAEQVQRELVAAGFEQSEVKIYQLSSEESSSEEPGFWHDIKSYFGFPTDSNDHLYEEAARQGLVPVVIDVPDGSPERKRASEIMGSHQPIDVAAQAGHWQRGAMAPETTEKSAPNQGSR